MINLSWRAWSMIVIFWVIMAFQVAHAAPQRQQIIEVVNNEVEPYIYRENGEFKGLYYERLTKLFAQANLGFELKLMPWPRAYRTLLQQPNTLVVSIGRTPRRESKFNWVGKISEERTDMFYYKLKKNNFDFEKLTTTGPYIVGVLRDTYYEDYVEQEQFDSNYYYAVLKAEDLIQMMLRGRVDVVIFSEEYIQQLANDLNVKIDNFDKLGFAFSVSHYMAFSPNSAQPLVEKVRKAYNEVSWED